MKRAKNAISVRWDGDWDSFSYRTQLDTVKLFSLFLLRVRCAVGSGSPFHSRYKVAVIRIDCCCCSFFFFFTQCQFQFHCDVRPSHDFDSLTYDPLHRQTNLLDFFLNSLFVTQEQVEPNKYLHMKLKIKFFLISLRRCIFVFRDDCSVQLCGRLEGIFVWL